MDSAIRARAGHLDRLHWQVTPGGCSMSTFDVSHNTATLATSFIERNCVRLEYAVATFLVCTQDVHAWYRMSVYNTVVVCFNEHSILSLGSCDDCLILNDELNVLPISRGKDIKSIEEEHGKGKATSELKAL
ncbi:uncharacterized protein B0H18DRAFT_1124901 [Fomitopsis serialis]|uniref:uncharacterized protein n=1 Tax=Fomitopsis serialis TaxID=139415 RepID=UPI00200856D6|nr:uncharacterized protein B0H18DRAFT_1124901 [Neoantrodia serialis]KAH9915511.1 hypothetical protein B0H18DRAFT_1124901 [Neoantrodia serialis]